MRRVPQQLWKAKAASCQWDAGEKCDTWPVRGAPLSKVFASFRGANVPTTATIKLPMRSLDAELRDS